MIKVFKVAMVVVFLVFNSACADGLGLWTVKVKVVDDTGLPIVDAKVFMNFLLPEGSNNYIDLSNNNGIVQKTRPGVLRVVFLVTKDGYYDARLEGARGSQEVEIVLRKKENPIPMYARKSEIHDPKEKFADEWVGYDLILGDYVMPHGKGVYKDFEFKYKYEEFGFWNYRFDLEIRFSNYGDGLIEFKPKDSSSKFKSDYLAPDSGYMKSSKYYRYRAGNGASPETNLDDFRNYYFRVRSKIDENGNLVSALYGKLYSEFPKLHYYLNPNDNDRNVEFDPKQNLFFNLPQKERQFEP
jgi:hypothetical protein